jgi:hypothetical protein
MPARVTKVTNKAKGKEVADVSDEPGKEWVGTPLDAVEVDPHAIVEITVQFDEGEEVLAPKRGGRFGSYDLNEAARYLYFLSNHIHKGGSG